MRKANFRILLFGVLIIIALLVVVLRGDQLLELIRTMKGGSFIPLLLAVLLQFGKYISQGFAYSASFKTVGENSVKAKEMFPLVFSSYFMNVVAPSFNTAGVVLVIDSARKRGIATGRATSAVMLMQISVISGFIVIMILGFSILQMAGRLSAIYFLLGMVVIFLVGVMVAVMYLGYKNPTVLLALFKPIEKFANHISVKLRKGKQLAPWAEKMVVSFAEAGDEISKNPKQAALAFLFSTLASTFELGCFGMVGIAFGLSSLAVLIGGYVVATLFSWVAITPQGVGVAEAMIAVALIASGISGTMAAAIAVVYRGIVFWMPFAIGAVLIYTTRSFKRDKDRLNAAPNENSTASKTQPKCDPKIAKR